MARSKKKRRSVRAAQQISQGLLRRLLAQKRLNAPLVFLVFRHRLAQWIHQITGTQDRGGIPLLRHSKKGRLSWQPYLSGLGCHHARCILCVVFHLVEMNPPHPVLHVQLVLEQVRNRFWIPDNQQIVRDLTRVHHTRHTCTVPLGKQALRVLGQVAIGAFVFFVEGLILG